MPLVLCSSGLSPDARRRLEASAAALSGVCSPDLTDQTTHLVAESVTPRSRKLACARRLGLPVVRPSWIHDSAARGALLPLAEGLLSPLAGVVLCVSGISFRADEREWVEAAVENAGGRFSRVLDANCIALTLTLPRLLPLPLAITLAPNNKGARRVDHAPHDVGRTRRRREGRGPARALGRAFRDARDPYVVRAAPNPNPNPSPSPKPKPSS